MTGARDRWARLVRQWRSSGQTSREFAAEAGIKASTLTYWAWRLKRDAGGRVRGTRRRRRRQEVSRTGRAPFVELRAAVASECDFELELLDGRRLRVPASFDAAALRRLLGALEGGER